MVYEDNYERMENPIIYDNEEGANIIKGVIILDLEASCHMINNNLMMSNHRKIKNKSFKITGFNG